MVDVSPPPTLNDVEQMKGGSAPWDITEGLDRLMLSGDAPSSRSDAVLFILREWLISNGYLDLPPEDEAVH